MCNDYRLEVDIASIAEDFEDLKIKIDMPEGAPNVPAREDVRITDMGPIVKASDGSAMGELVNRRWSWPGQAGKQACAKKVGWGRGPRCPRGCGARHSGSAACARSGSTKSVWRGGSSNSTSFGSVPSSQCMTLRRSMITPWRD